MATIFYRFEILSTNFEYNLKKKIDKCSANIANDVEATLTMNVFDVVNETKIQFSASSNVSKYAIIFQFSLSRFIVVLGRKRLFFFSHSVAKTERNKQLLCYIVQSTNEKLVLLFSNMFWQCYAC